MNGYNKGGGGWGGSPRSDWLQKMGEQTGRQDYTTALKALMDQYSLMNKPLVDPSAYQMNWGDVAPLDAQALQQQLFEAMWPEAKEAFLSQQAAMGKLPSGQTDIGLGNLTAKLMASAAQPGFQAAENRAQTQMGAMANMQNLMAQQQFQENLYRLQREWALQDIKRAEKAQGGGFMGNLLGGIGGAIGGLFGTGMNPMGALLGGVGGFTGQQMPWGNMGGGGGGQGNMLNNYMNYYNQYQNMMGQLYPQNYGMYGPNLPPLGGG